MSETAPVEIVAEQGVTVPASQFPPSGERPEDEPAEDEDPDDELVEDERPEEDPVEEDEDPVLGLPRPDDDELPELEPLDAEPSVPASDARS